MKIKTIKEELKGMKKDALEAKIDEMRRDLLTLRLQAATTPIKTFSSTKRGLKRAIACGLTYLHQQENVSNG